MKIIQVEKLILTKDVREVSIFLGVLSLVIVFLGYGGVSLQVAYAADSSTASVVINKNRNGWIPEVWTEYQKSSDTSIFLPDFSRAGYAMGDCLVPENVGPVFNVTAPVFGAVPNDLNDDTTAIQAAINAAQATGGGVVFLPKGRYDIRKNPNQPVIRITGSNVIVRGEGDGKNGTILYLWSPAPVGNVRRLGSVPADQAARSGAVLSVIGGEEHNFITNIIEDVRRGETVVRVADSSSFHVGQFVVIELKDPLIDEMNPRPEKAAIAVELTKPYKLIDQQKDTFGKAAQVYTWTVQIAEIRDNGTIRLEKPARFDHLQSYQPVILSFRGAQKVGIENLRIKSSWPGNYQHHKPYKNEDVIVRTAKEQDYLWNGIWISHLVDGWVKNITFENLTQGMIVSHSANSTFESLTFLGKEGHAGITLGRSNDLLVSQVDFYAPLVHPVTLSMMSSGNVITDSATYYDGRNELTGTDAVIDFHGLFPFENLFENLRGFYVCPGGDMSVLPHAGVRNVFWNIVAPEKMSCYTTATDDEFFRTYATVGTTSHSQATMYEHAPQAFFIGITRKGGKAVTVGQTTVDRKNKWHVVEGLGREGIGIKSLYRAQVDIRHARRMSENALSESAHPCANSSKLQKNNSHR